MRSFALYILGVLFLGGCLSPSTIKPLASDNLKNIQNLRANNTKLYEHYEEVVTAGGRLELLHRLQAVSMYLTDFTTAIGGVDSQKLTTAVNQLKPVVDQNKTIMSPEDFENFRRSLATERPIVGDIAASFVPQKRVEEIIPIFHQTFRSSLTARTKVRSAEPYLREFYLVNSWEQALKDTLQALRDFLSVIREQENLAENHAQAFQMFSVSKADFTDIAKSLTADMDVQTSIAKLIEMRTNDSKRKAAAQELLKTLGEIDNRSSDPELRK